MPSQNSVIEEIREQQKKAFVIAFCAVLLNANTLEDNAATAAAWDEAFMEYAGIDPEAYQVNIDTSITLSADGGGQYEVANRQKPLPRRSWLPTPICSTIRTVPPLMRKQATRWVIPATMTIFLKTTPLSGISVLHY